MFLCRIPTLGFISPHLGILIWGPVSSSTTTFSSPPPWECPCPAPPNILWTMDSTRRMKRKPRQRRSSANGYSSSSIAVGIIPNPAARSRDSLTWCNIHKGTWKELNFLGSKFLPRPTCGWTRWRWERRHRNITLCLQTSPVVNGRSRNCKLDTSP